MRRSYFYGLPLLWKRCCVATPGLEGRRGWFMDVAQEQCEWFREQ